MCAAATAIIEDIVEQHFEEASFLWSQRDAATTATNYTLSDLAFLDERVEAHVDGLRVAGEYGWELCEAGLDPDEPGTLFTASIIAFESGDKERIELVVGASGESRTAFRAVVSGLGWMDRKRFNSLIMGLVSAKSRRYRRLGIAACGIRRINPKTYLDQAVNSSDLFLRTQAFKTAGVLKRLDLLPHLQKHFQDEDNACRFEAARSALLLGDSSAMDTLSAFVLSRSRFTLPAMQLAFRIIDGQTARTWLKSLSRDPKSQRLVLIGAGIVGDPAFMPMVIKQMKRPDMARAAGHAFSMISGVDLAGEGLEGEWPEGFEVGPNDDPEDEDVDMDPDEDLSWPDADLVAQWWARNSGAFSNGTRFLAGSPVSPDECSQIVKTGVQQLRQAAALELALSQPETAFFNIKAMGNAQLSRL
jgi:uncharacterized protein (TIGR02270 family)